MFFLSSVCYAFVLVCLYVPAGKGLTSWLSFVESGCDIGVVLDCINT